MKDVIPILGLVIVLPVVIFIFVFMPIYSNYEVCKEYYPKVNPLVCMMSTKTKVMGDTR